MIKYYITVDPIVINGYIAVIIIQTLFNLNNVKIFIGHCYCETLYVQKYPYLGIINHKVGDGIYKYAYPSVKLRHFHNSSDNYLMHYNMHILHILIQI